MIYRLVSRSCFSISFLTFLRYGMALTDLDKDTRKDPPDKDDKYPSIPLRLLTHFFDDEGLNIFG